MNKGKAFPRANQFTIQNYKLTFPFQFLDFNNHMKQRGFPAFDILEFLARSWKFPINTLNANTLNFKMLVRISSKILLLLTASKPFVCDPTGKAMQGSMCWRVEAVRSFCEEKPNEVCKLNF